MNRIPGADPRDRMDFPRIVKSKHRVLNFAFSNRKVLSKVLDALEVLCRAAAIPLLGRMHPFLRKRNNHFSHLPVNIDVKADSVPLPPQVAVELIKRSRFHHVLDKCLCRHGRDCQSHNHDIGCLFLGASGFDVVPQFSRRITAEEALAHVERALDNGLVPTVGRFRVDNYAFMTPDRHALLGVCFCCSCCCFLGYYRHAPAELVTPLNPHLSGLEIQVTGSCKGCGTCVSGCYMHAITVVGGRAVHSGACAGCGRCGRNCPNGSVEITLTDPAYYGKTVEKFFELSNID